MLRRYVSVAVAFLSLAGVVAWAGPADARGGRHAAMMFDANTGAILHNDGGDELRHPASLTKMMTLYMTFETIESGRMSMSDRVVISERAASVAPSKLDLDPGESLSVSEAIKALITKSANDVAVALAEKIGGSEANFVRLMNQRARDLGMTRTNFENASGLPDMDQVTTARDMITLGMRLQDDFPSFYPMFAMRAFSFKRASFRNHNTMLNNFSGMDGIKTGYTRKSGFNLVSSVRRGGKHVIGAVFGGSSAAARNGEMRMLLTRALTRASTVKTRKPKPALIAKLKGAPKIAERPVKPRPPVQMAAAEPRPAPRPQIQPPAKQQIAAAPAPEPVTVPEAFEPDEAVTAAAPPPALVGPELPPAPVELAKVKKIMVTPRSAPVSPDETTDMGEDGEPTIESLFARASLEASQETVIAKTTGPSPADTGGLAPAPRQAAVIDNSEMTMLGGRDAVPAAAAAVAPAVPAQAPVRKASAPAMKPAAKPAVIKASAVVPAPVPVQRGLPPSTLQAQAASLSTTSAPLHTAALPDTSGRYEIQIGAYDTVEEAQRNLDAVEARASRTLAGHPSVTHPVLKSGRQIYRARFRGFDAQSAATACSNLRAQSIDCFVMATE